MGFPRTRQQLVDQGYWYGMHKTCDVCRISIEFWHTPTGSLMPMNPMEDNTSPAVVHWANCKDPDRYRRKKPAQGERQL